MPRLRRSASTAARTSASGARSPRAIARPRERGVAHGLGLRPMLELEGDRQHDPAARRSLEGAGAVGEPALRRRDLEHRLEHTVIRPHGDDRLGDLLSVCADVLDRRRPDRAGDAREALDPRAAVPGAARDERIPRLTGGDLEAAAVLAHAARHDPHDRAREAGVGDDQVGPAPQHEERLCGGIGGADGRDDRTLAVDIDQTRRRPAQAQRREFRQALHPLSVLRGAHQP